MTAVSHMQQTQTSFFSKDEIMQHEKAETTNTKKHIKQKNKTLLVQSD